MKIKKLIKSAIALSIATMLTSANLAMAIPIGNDIEYIPFPRNLGVGEDSPNRKLVVNGQALISGDGVPGNDDLLVEGQIKITGGNPVLGRVLTTDADGLASWQPIVINNTTITNTNVTGGIINGAQLISQDDLKVADDGTFGDTVTARAFIGQFFNGGLFRGTFSGTHTGDGSGLTGISATTVAPNTTIVNPTITGGTATGTNVTGGIINGSNLISQDDVKVADDAIIADDAFVGDTVTARAFVGQVFNGGVFRGTFTGTHTGDGSGLTGISATTVAPGTTINNPNINNATITNSTFTGGSVTNATVTGGTITNANVTGGIINGSNLISQDDVRVKDDAIIGDDAIVGDTVTARAFIGQVFNGGVFRGDGSGLTNIAATTINNTTINNVISQNGKLINGDIFQSNITNSTINNTTINNSSINNGGVINGAQLISRDDLRVRDDATIGDSLTARAVIAQVFNGGVFRGTFTGTHTGDGSGLTGITATTVAPGTTITNPNINNATITNSTFTGGTVTGTAVTNATVTGGTITNANVTGGIINGSQLISQDDVKAKDTVTARAVIAQFFNGGVFRGDGSGLTNVAATTINNTTVNNVISQNGKLINGDIFQSNITNSTINNSNVTGGIINGSQLISQDDLKVKDDGTFGDTVTARAFIGQVFNGGVFRGTFSGTHTGDGSGLTGISATTVAPGTTINNPNINNATITNSTFTGGTVTGTAVTNPTVTGGTITNTNHTGGVINGSQLISQDDLKVADDAIIGDTIRARAVIAQFFNGGVFRGDGSGLTNVAATTINNTTVNNVISQNGRLINGDIFQSNITNSTVNNTTITNSNVTGGIINGAQLISQDDLRVRDDATIGDSVTARAFIGQVFNGGVFRGTFTGTHTGDGSGLTNIPATSITGNVRPNALFITGSSTPEAQILADGSLGILSGNDVVFQGVGSDAGDIIFKNAAGNEKARIYSDTNAKNGLALSVGAASPEVYLDPNGNLGVNTLVPTEKLEVGGNVKATRFIGDGSGLTGITATTLANNSTINNATINNSTFTGGSTNNTTHNNSTINNSTITNTNIRGGVINGTQLISQDDLRVVDDAVIGDSVRARAFIGQVFNGGVFRGDGSALTNIPATSITGNVRPNALFITGSSTPEAQILADGSLGILSGNDVVFQGVGSDAGDIIFLNGTGNEKARIYSDTNAKNGLALSVGAASPEVYLDPNGNLGVNTLVPTEKLEVGGNVKATRFIGDGSGITNISGNSITGNVRQSALFIAGSSTPEAQILADGSLGILSGNDVVFQGVGSDAGDIIFKNAAGNEKARIYSDTNAKNGLALSVGAASPEVYLDPNGNLGVNTLVPTEKLEVGGNVKATRFIGDGSGLTGITATTVANNTTINNATINNSTITGGSTNNTTHNNATINNSTINNSNHTGGIINGTQLISQDDVRVRDDVIVGDTVTARAFIGQVFNGGVFRGTHTGTFTGDGSGLTNINLTGTTFTNNTFNNPTINNGITNNTTSSNATINSSTINNSTINNSNVTGGTINGNLLISQTDLRVKNKITARNVTAQVFNGGVFRGDGSQLTGITATNAVNATNVTGGGSVVNSTLLNNTLNNNSVNGQIDFTPNGSINNARLTGTTSIATLGGVTGGNGQIKGAPPVRIVTATGGNGQGTVVRSTATCATDEYVVGGGAKCDLVTSDGVVGYLKENYPNGNNGWTGMCTYQAITVTTYAICAKKYFQVSP